VRPGKYRLIAIGPQQMADYAEDRETAEALFRKAPEIEIHEGDRITRDVKPAAEEGSTVQQ